MSAHGTFDANARWTHRESIHQSHQDFPAYRCRAHGALLGGSVVVNQHGASQTGIDSLCAAQHLPFADVVRRLKMTFSCLRDSEVKCPQATARRTYSRQLRIPTIVRISTDPDPARKLAENPETRHPGGP